MLSRTLSALAAEHCAASCEVGKVFQEVGELESEMRKLQRERMEAQVRCRELMTQIQVSENKGYEGVIAKLCFSKGTEEEEN